KKLGEWNLKVKNGHITRMAFDLSKNLYVIGRVGNTQRGFLAKFDDNSGKELWSNVIENKEAPGNHTELNDLLVNGRWVYVIGEQCFPHPAIEHPEPGSPDIDNTPPKRLLSQVFVRRFDKRGSEKWKTFLGDHGWSKGLFVDVHPNGNLVVGGRWWENSILFHFAHLDAANGQVIERNRGAHFRPNPISGCLDQEGEVYLVGRNPGGNLGRISRVSENPWSIDLDVGEPGKTRFVRAAVTRPPSAGDAVIYAVGSANGSILNPNDINQIKNYFIASYSSIAGEGWSSRLEGPDPVDNGNEITDLEIYRDRLFIVGRHAIQPDGEKVFLQVFKIPK
ncbi:MAG: hypothetical protein AAGH89_04410, partial [Verrucomicrobiota bacterium]